MLAADTRKAEVRVMQHIQPRDLPPCQARKSEATEYWIVSN